MQVQPCLNPNSKNGPRSKQPAVIISGQAKNNLQPASPIQSIPSYHHSLVVVLSALIDWLQAGVKVGGGLTLYLQDWIGLGYL